MNRKNKKIFLVIIITSIIVVTLSLSRYRSSVATDNTTRVAIPVINLNESNSSNLNFTMNPIDNIQRCIFEVSNYSDGQDSEVSMEYSIKISSSSNLPLEYLLYKYNDETKKEDGENLLSENNLTQMVTMPVGNKKSDKYILIIKWDEGENSYLYSKEVDYVQVNVNSRQLN